MLTVCGYFGIKVIAVEQLSGGPLVIAQSDQHTYLDLMALAMAMVSATKLKADSEEWSKAWMRALSQPEMRELLPQVVFEKRDPYPPLSDQVEALIRSLSRSGILSLHNPRYRHYTMATEDKARIRDANADVLATHSELLRAIAKILDEELHVS